LRQPRKLSGFTEWSRRAPSDIDGSPKGERAGASASNTLQFSTSNSIQQQVTKSESSNRTNRRVQGAVRGNCVEPGEESLWSNCCSRRRDREVFRKAEVCSAAAPEVLSYPAEIRRNHAADGLGLYPDVGLAIRARICPAPVGA